MNELHVRTVSTTVEFSEGRLFARIMPYDVAKEVADMLPSGRFETYHEGFRLGAFHRQASTNEPGVLRRVALKHEHDGGLGYLGPLMSLDDRADGLYGEFRVLPSLRDDVAELHDIGIQELSVEFLERKGGTVEEDGVRWRTDVHLGAVALLPRGAYGDVGASVLAMRELSDIIAEQEADDEAERQRVEAEAAAQAAEEAAVEARKRALAEVESFLAAAQAKQDELNAHFGISA